MAWSTPAKIEVRGSTLHGLCTLECTYTNVYSENKGTNVHGTQTSSLGVHEALNFFFRKQKFWLSSSAVLVKVLGRCRPILQFRLHGQDKTKGGVSDDGCR